MAMVDKAAEERMVERVARVLLQQELAKGWDAYDDTVHADYMADARAAIAAMREPTEPMLMAADHHQRHAMLASNKSTWQVMIDSALTE